MNTQSKFPHTRESPWLRVYHKKDWYNINPKDKNIDKISELWLNDDRQAIVDIMEMPRMLDKFYENYECSI